METTSVFSSQDPKVYSIGVPRGIPRVKHAPLAGVGGTGIGLNTSDAGEGVFRWDSRTHAFSSTTPAVQGLNPDNHQRELGPGKYGIPPYEAQSCGKKISWAANSKQRRFWMSNVRPPARSCRRGQPGSSMFSQAADVWSMLRRRKDTRKAYPASSLTLPRKTADTGLKQRLRTTSRATRSAKEWTQSHLAQQSFMRRKPPGGRWTQSLSRKTARRHSRPLRPGCKLRPRAWQRTLTHSICRL